MSSAPETFGKYQILERIASGGMAEIYKAKLEGIGGFQRTFAIKRVLPHLSQNADYVAMLVDEAKVAGLLSHANIVQILDLGQVEQTWYIAMEYVRGRDLGAVLKRCQERGLTLPVPHACFVAIELLKGLQYAHQRQVMRGGRPVPLNIIHRDVSPPNVLLAYQGEVKLTDFGIARASLKVMETQAGVIKGRFDYMSPEQAAATRDLDQRSDLFSVGVVLYEMLAGTHPFRQDSEIDTLEAVREGKFPPLSERNPDVPFALETIVNRALCIDREERYASAIEFKEALDTFFHDSGFLFTQDTLGTYVQGLFPEDLPKKASYAPIRDTGDVEAPPTEEVQLLDADEGPTRVMDSPLAPVPVVKPKLVDTPTPPPASSVGELPIDPDETLIQPNQLAIDRKRRSAEHLMDEPDTVAETPAPPAPPPSPQALRQGMVVSGGNARPTPAPAPPRPPEPSGSSLTAVFVGVGALAAGILLGLAAGATGALFLGPQVNESRPPPAARLEVAAPPEAVVRVNGVVVAGSVTVDPNQPQTVAVSVGDARWESSVSVGPGETRIVVVQSVQPEPEEPTP